MKLVPPPFVKRFLSGRRKTDARDAKATLPRAHMPDKVLTCEQFR